MMLTLMVTSKGVAGVPRAALVVLTATLVQFKLPLEGAAILLAIDQILDMGRTSVNVMGNCIATAVVARWEGVFDDAKMRAFAATPRTVAGRSKGRNMVSIPLLAGPVIAALIFAQAQRRRRLRNPSNPASAWRARTSCGYPRHLRWSKKCSTWRRSRRRTS